MLIFISPSKTFTDEIIPGNSPIFEEKTASLLNRLKTYSKDELKDNFLLSDKLVDEVYDYYHTSNQPSAAIFRYGGILYKSLDANTLNFKNNQIFILSGLYGLLNSHDEIIKYRIDYTHRMLGNLYSYWKDDIHQYLVSNYNNDLYIDLTSKEFEVLIPNPKIRIDFKLNDKSISTVLLKQMRGLMARTLVNENITDLVDLKNLNVNGFIFNPLLSTPNLYMFTK